MLPQRLEVLDDLSIVIDRCVVLKLRPDEAFDTAEQLVRLGMRRILAEEHAEQRLADAMPNPTNTRTIS